MEYIDCKKYSSFGFVDFSVEQNSKLFMEN